MRTSMILRRGESLAFLQCREIAGDLEYWIEASNDEAEVRRHLGLLLMQAVHSLQEQKSLTALFRRRVRRMLA